MSAGWFGAADLLTCAMRAHSNRPSLGRSIAGRYERTNLAGLSMPYAFGLARNDPCIDGNTGIACVAMVLFLWLNGARFAPG